MFFLKWIRTYHGRLTALGIWRLIAILYNLLTTYTEPEHLRYSISIFKVCAKQNDKKSNMY